MRYLKASLLAFALALSYGQAQAASTTYYITQSNTTPPFPDGPDYAHVVVTDTGTSWNFTVSLASAFSAYPTAEIDQFAFNTGGVGGVPVTFSSLPTGWAGTYNADTYAMDGFGKFDATVGKSGQTNLQTLSFTVTPNTPISFNSVGGCAQGQGCTWFAMHVKQIPTGYTDPTTGLAVTSAFFGSGSDPTLPPSSVPIPAAAWLLGSGLIGLAGVARRKAK